MVDDISNFARRSTCCSRGNINGMTEQERHWHHIRLCHDFVQIIDAVGGDMVGEVYEQYVLWISEIKSYEYEQAKQEWVKIND